MDILFPHDNIRNVQDDLIRDIADCVNNKKNMLIHAPTGIGKTAAVFSATLGNAIKNKKTIFFVTSRHTQHKIAIDTLRMIKKKFNVNLNVADFIGKRWMCLIPNALELGTAEFYDYCHEHIERGTCEFYNNMREKGKLSVVARHALDMLKGEIMPVNEVMELCRKSKLCPHEITMMHAQSSNVAIADYFHILNSSIRESILKRSRKEINDVLVVFDEGHNLAERCRDLLTASLSTFVVENSIKELRSMRYDDIAVDVENVSNALMNLNKKIGLENNEVLVQKQEFYDAIGEEINYSKLASDLMKIGDVILEEKKRSYTKHLANFMDRWQGPDEGYARILKRGFTKRGKINVNLTYRCMDPSIVLKPLAGEAEIIVMSGTLSPVGIYKDLFGFEADAKEYKDPFPASNRLNLIVPEITTKFTSRDDEMYQKIGEIAANITNSVNGNSIVFFPSYKMIDDVARHFNRTSAKTTLFEKPKLSKDDKEYLLNTFKKYKDRGAVLLACASGSFGEGIDLPGDYLKAVLIVGLPLAKQDLEVKEVIKYYDKKFNNGWDYGYVFPALIRCFQNAGRCIRSESDKGAIVFLDSRYCLSRYRKFFPAHWEMNITKDPVPIIESFFKNGIHKPED